MTARHTSRTTTRTTFRLAAAAGVVAAALTSGVPLAAAGTGADGHAAAQEAYLAYQSSRAQTAHDSQWSTPLEEYVRVLIYWHNHPNWGFGH